MKQLNHILYFVIFILIVQILTPSVMLSQVDTARTNSMMMSVIGEDTLMSVKMAEIKIYAPPKHKSWWAKNRYNRKVRNIKKVLPYAKDAGRIIMETNDSLIKIESKKERKKYLKMREKFLFNKYEKKLRKLTFSQGRLLIRLIDRETNQTAYKTVREYKGKFKAWFWNSIAYLFRSSLKYKYDPNGRDKETERIIYMIEMGMI